MHTSLSLSHKQLLCGIFFVSCMGAFFAVPQAYAQSTSESISLPNTFPETLSLTIKDQTQTVSAPEIQTWLTVQTSIGIDTSHPSEIEDSRLCPYSFLQCDFFLSQKTRSFIQNQSHAQINSDDVRAFVTTLNTSVSKAPIDAKFTMNNGKIEAFTLSQEGYGLDIEKSVEIIAHELTQPSTSTLVLPIITIAPSLASSDASALGITELIGEGTTNFAGSPKNRVHNFKRAIEQFDGLMIAPDEEFSFVKFLGDVDGEHGYLPELVIKHNKTEPEFGGGVCQVSSTIFRAAVYSGLKITMRRNHAYPVRYYAPYGMDATIYIPKPDLRFINNTSGHILMQASIEGTKLTFRFYGTSGGRKTEVDGPHILEHGTDGSMKTIFTQKVTDGNGNTFINDEFRSNYASPSKYPHPGQEPIFTEKPDDWSKDQWSAYRKAHNL